MKHSFFKSTPKINICLPFKNKCMPFFFFGIHRILTDAFASRLRQDHTWVNISVSLKQLWFGDMEITSKTEIFEIKIRLSVLDLHKSELNFSYAILLWDAETASNMTNFENAIFQHHLKTSDKTNSNKLAITFVTWKKSSTTRLKFER